MQGSVWVLLYFAALAGLALNGLHRAWLLAVAARRRPPAEGEPPDLGRVPHVTVQCPIFNEPEVAVRLLEAAAGLDHPREFLEVQVLDDSTDDTTALIGEAAARARARGLDVTVLHRDHREGFKAGALAAGLLAAKGELIAVFDADFVPPRSFLREILPAFADPEVGLVQARWGHLNRESSWLTRVQALLLDGHFFVEHAARASSGRFFNFNGTAGVFRRRCIEDAGGWEHDTLTEDLDLSYRAQLAGWRFVYLEDVIAPAELPADVNAWKSQQRRWTRGAVQSARKLLPRLLRSVVPRRVKLEAVVHLTSNAAWPLLLCLALTIFPAALARDAWGWGPLSAVEVPLLAATTGAVAAVYLFAARRAGTPGALLLLPGLIAAGFGLSLNNTRAAIAGLSGEVGTFVRTPKSGESGSGPLAAPRHRIAPDSWAVAEIGLGLILGGEAVAASVLALWPTVPFLVLAAAGFLAVGTGSLRAPRPARREAGLRLRVTPVR